MNIICVEDSLRHLCALQQTTRQIAPEASVYACLNADDAEKTAQKYGCDVLLTGIDVGKSETGGIELARQVKKITPPCQHYFHHGASRTGIREGRAPAPGQRIYPQTFFLAGVEKGI